MTKPQKNRALPHWNLSLFYSSDQDPKIETDMKEVENLFEAFAKSFDTPIKDYLTDRSKLLAALEEYEKLMGKSSPWPLLYYIFKRDTNGGHSLATAKINNFTQRLTKVENRIRFFEIALGSIPPEKQAEFLDSFKLKHFSYFLSCLFSDAKHLLSLPEEKIMALKSQTSQEMWVSQNSRILSSQSLVWKGKTLPMAEALDLVASLKTQKERASLSARISEVLKKVAPFSEGEINAVITNRKVDDELRGFKKPYENTVRHYRNDPKVVENLIKVVTDNFKVAHRFYKLKAKLLKLHKLNYSDRAAKLGVIKQKFGFEESVSQLKEIFGSVRPKYSETLESFLKTGRIDAEPRVGKRSGAYCACTYGSPTFLLLNHLNDLHSFTTFAHEMGHALHFESSRIQSPLHFDISTALAETASTLFEGLALDAVLDKLSDKEKIIVLHDKINADIATIFRQVACFNFELELHNDIREKGFLTKEEIGSLHNKNMQAYLGPLFKLTPDDGYMFVQWSHIRRFFYVYSYAYGMLVSKALLCRYRANHSFWSHIEKFLSAGGKNSPEKILKEIGLDLTSPGFFEEGIREIEENIEKLERLVKEK
ncbi:MAG: M3 family metallopeptidase [Candidatus Paceibacterota bacterium]